MVILVPAIVWQCYLFEYKSTRVSALERFAAIAVDPYRRIERGEWKCWSYTILDTRLLALIYVSSLCLEDNYDYIVLQHLRLVFIGDIEELAVAQTAVESLTLFARGPHVKQRQGTRGSNSLHATSTH